MQSACSEKHEISNDENMGTSSVDADKHESK